MATSTGQSETERLPEQRTETGLDENVAAALAYVLGFLTGLGMFFIESETDHGNDPRIPVAAGVADDLV